MTLKFSQIEAEEEMQGNLLRRKKGRASYFFDTTLSVIYVFLYFFFTESFPSVSSAVMVSPG